MNGRRAIALSRMWVSRFLPTNVEGVAATVAHTSMMVSAALWIAFEAQGELKAVLILSPDRLTRQFAYQYIVVEELERAGSVTSSAPAFPALLTTGNAFKFFLEVFCRGI